MTSNCKPIRIYKASAGSGKTFTLAAEFIANLLNDFDTFDNAHRHQLAITFTKKATNEMKERILQYLYDLAYNKMANVGMLAAVRARLTQPLSDTAICDRAKKTLHQILHGYDHFRVMTIDSFFQSMLTSLAHDLGLSAGFRVELNDKNTTSRAVEKLLRELRPGSQELAWVTRFVEERLEDSKSWNVSFPLNELAEELTKEVYMTNADRLRALPLDSTTIKDYRADINALKQGAKELIQKKATQLDADIFNNDGYSKLKYGKTSFQGFLKKYIDWNFGKTGSVDKVSTDTIDKFIADPVSKLNKKYVGPCDAWVESLAKDFAAFRQCVDNELKTINSCELSLQKLNSLRLLDNIDREVRALNRESNAFMLAYTPLLFHKLVGTDEVSFVFERAGTNFRHIMIDEFQDTSHLQWENLSHLFCETTSTGNSSMIVGDVKQGIYRWRGGDWNTLAQFRDDANTEINHLEANYRSGERIVRFNNRLFVHAAQVLDEDGLDDEQTITHLYAEKEVEQAPKNDGGFVRVHILPEPEKANPEEGEATVDPVGEANDVEQELAEQIIRLRQAGIPYDKMAILVRVKAEAQRLLSFFATLSAHEYFTNDPIQLMSDEAFLLESSSAVQTIVHTLRLVLHSDDGVARAYVEAHSSPEQQAEVFEKIHQWQGEFYRNVPFYELVEQIVELFALNAQKGQAPYLYAFLDAVITFLEENIPDIATFLKYWDEKLHEQSIPSAAAKGVRILTIHKSKGLDFHTVFIPYCNWDIEKDRNSDLLWVEPEESPYNKIPLLPIALNNKTANSIYAPHYVQEHISRRVESLNIGYVAFTRPRQNIVVIAPYKGSNTFREVLAAALWRTTQENEELRSCLSISHLGHMPEGDDANDEKSASAPAFSAEGELLFEWGTPSHLECETDSVKKEKTNPLLFDPTAETVQYALNDRKVQVVQSNSAHLFNARLLEDADTHGEIEQLEARRRGEMLHAILEKVDTADQVEAAVNRFASEGRLVDNADAATVIQQLTEALAQPAAREWFDGSWSLYRERNILRKGKMPQRPDRVMERNGETVVVDYKFGAPHRRHHEQVQQYCALLTQMGRRNVRGFVWYVYTGRIDPVELEPNLFHN